LRGSWRCDELNAYGGKLLAAYGAFLVLAGVIESGLAPQPGSLWLPLLIAVPLLVVIPVVWLINVRGRRLLRTQN
jgi:hypothetical protein